jgi:outer membrane protein TolC
MDVRQAYIALISAKSVLDTYEQQLKLQDELLALAKKRVKQDSSSQMDVIQAEIARNQLYTQVNSAKIEVRREILDFNKAINADSLGKGCF